MGLTKDHTLVAVLNENLVVIRKLGGRTHVYSRARPRKDYVCARCGTARMRYFDRAFRPVTNGADRAERICSPCMRKLIEEAE